MTADDWDVVSSDDDDTEFWDDMYSTLNGEPCEVTRHANGCIVMVKPK